MGNDKKTITQELIIEVPKQKQKEVWKSNEAFICSFSSYSYNLSWKYTWPVAHGQLGPPNVQFSNITPATKILVFFFLAPGGGGNNAKCILHRDIYYFSLNFFSPPFKMGGWIGNRVALKECGKKKYLILK